MRIYCAACDHKGRIGSREEITRRYVKLYCQCLDPQCGHTWVSELTFKHSLQPPAQQLDTLLVERIRNLSPAQQQELFLQVSSPPQD